MSHLQFPRLHFRGQFSTNVGTANNDGWSSRQFVDSGTVTLDTMGMSDADFSKWLREIEPGQGLRGGWNIYGDGTCRFVDVTCHSAEPDFGVLSTSAANDSVIGATVGFRGIMVDQDPEGTVATQIFASQFNVAGPGGAAITGGGSRAVSRWVARKNLGVTGFRAFSAVWHSVIPPGQLTIVPGTSRTLQTMKNAQSQGNGLFIRYCTYLLSPRLTDSQLAADFAAGRNTINPAIGVVLGTIGVWDPNEPRTFAIGRQLGTGAAATHDHQQFQFNPATFVVDETVGRVSVDLINSIPEVNDALEKVNVGDLDLTLTSAAGVKTVLGTIANTRSDYELRAGIADFNIPANALADIADGTLAVVQRSTQSALLDETPLVLETDDRAVYVQQGEQAAITLRGWRNGAPAVGARVSIRQFLTTNKTFAQAPPATAVVAIPATVALNASGAAQVAFTATAPGCSMLVFTGDEDPEPMDFFACVRVLPHDDFSNIPDAQITFQFVYEKVLRYYHLLHPAMDVAMPSGFDLSDENEVVTRADRIRTRIRDTNFENLGYMPRTRELSKGKIELLVRWCDSVSPQG